MIACALLVEPARASESVGAQDPAGLRSQRIRAAIRAGLPGYEPRTEAGVKMTESTDAAVEEEGTLRLPKVTVEAKIPRISDYAMLTPKGRMEMALKRYPGAKVGNLFGLNNGIALALLEEDVEAGKRDAVRTRVEAVAPGDTPADRQLKRLMQDAVARPNTDWLKGRSGR